MTALKCLKVCLKLFQVSPSRSVLLFTALSTLFYIHEAISLSIRLKKSATFSSFS